MVTDDDRNMIVYFVRERGDVERWASWEDRRKEIAEEYPELIEVLRMQLVVKRLLSAVIDKIAEEI